LIDKLEFYITNVCNLTCNGCNRYNNYKFSGWQSWDEAEPILTRWAEKIDIRHPVILGGEPLLNPDIVKWIKGIRKLWPDHSGVQVQSNGTRIDRVPDLADALDPGKVVDFLYSQLTGGGLPSPSDKAAYVDLILNKTYSIEGLAVAAAELPLNPIEPSLVGLATSGLPFILPS
jgi:uncharacterized radical SAM superfamily Fe-S cluster-containing enzyme